jgi:ketosteroid isomerase-like protein
MATSPSAAEQTVRDLFTAFAARDLEGALALLHPEVELWAQPTAELTRRIERYRGRDGFREYLADVDRVWERFSVEQHDYRVAGGGVICFGAAEGRPRGADTVRRLPVVWVFRLRDGLVAYCRVARTAAEATELVDGSSTEPKAEPDGVT